MWNRERTSAQRFDNEELPTVSTKNFDNKTRICREKHSKTTETLISIGELVYRNNFATLYLRKMNPSRWQFLLVNRDKRMIIMKYKVSVFSTVNFVFISVSAFFVHHI